MRVTETAHFVFGFNGNLSNKERLNKLKELLYKNGWLSENGDKKLPLNSFHVENNGDCSVTLSEDIISSEFIENTIELYQSLEDCADVKWIKVQFSSATKSIVYNNVERYAYCHTIDITQMKRGDMVLVYMT